MGFGIYEWKVIEGWVDSEMVWDCSFGVYSPTNSESHVVENGHLKMLRKMLGHIGNCKKIYNCGWGVESCVVSEEWSSSSTRSYYRYYKECTWQVVEVIGWYF